MKKKLLAVIILILIIASVGANAQQATYDTVLFETPTNTIIIDTNAGNLWQIGTADKAFLNVGHWGPNSIVTDTINPYSANSTSSFIYVIRDPFTHGCVTTMQFWHKYDIDSLDYGEIEASYDGGASWITAKDTILYDPGFATFWWDYDFHEATQTGTWHDTTITGTSDGWIRSHFQWNWFYAVSRDTIIINPDSLMIRFTFHSDSIFDNKEGWMIDEIWVESLNGDMYCSSVKKRDIEQNLDVFPNPFKHNAALHLKKSLKNGTMTLVNTFGQQVFKQINISGNQIFLSRNNLKTGVYIIRIVDEGKLIASKRIVVTD